MRHFVVVGILVIVVSILAYAGLMAVGLMPVEASAQSVPIDRLLDLEWATISFLSALILVPFTYSLVVFRRKKGDTTDASSCRGEYQSRNRLDHRPTFPGDGLCLSGRGEPG